MNTLVLLVNLLLLTQLGYPARKHQPNLEWNEDYKVQDGRETQ